MNALSLTPTATPMGLAGDPAPPAAEPAKPAEPAGRTYRILLARLDGLLLDLGKLSARLTRRHLSPLAWTVGKAVTTRSHVNLDAPCTGPGCAGCGSRTRIPVTLLGELPKLAGWTFIAALDHLDGENLVRTLPGTVCPLAFRTRGPVCDHCRVDRRRTSTYVLTHEDGRAVQVGSTCLRDFLGSHEADALAVQASFIAQAAELSDDACSEDGFGGGRRSAVALDTFLAEVERLILEGGWVSRKVVNDGCPLSTSDQAWINTTAGERDTQSVLGAASTLPEDAAAWAEGLSDATTFASEYLHNLRAIARSGYVAHKSAGLAASLLVAYQRAMGEERKRQAYALRPISSYVGALKERRSFGRVRLDFVTGYPTEYGYTTILKFVTLEASAAASGLLPGVSPSVDAGAVLVWKASNAPLSRDDVGKDYFLTGTVKAHEERKSERQTLVTRCKVDEVQADAAPAAAQASTAQTGLQGEASMKKLTSAQLRALRLLAAGREPTEGLVGRSAHGGFSRTWYSLVKAGLVFPNVTGKEYAERITDAGLAALGRAALEGSR